MKFMRVELFVPTLPHKPHEALLDRVVLEVGGASVLPMVGYWNPDSTSDTMVEPGKHILLFMEDSDDNRMWLEEILLRYKEEAEQQSVMYVINTNEVIFLED